MEGPGVTGGRENAEGSGLAREKLTRLVGDGLVWVELLTLALVVEDEAMVAKALWI